MLLRKRSMRYPLAAPTDPASQQRVFMDRFAEIQVFICVLEEGSFSAAARKLDLSPSAVSKVIQRLEARLNVRLFERLGAVVRPTAEADKLGSAGLRAIQALEYAESSVQPKQALDGVVRIYTALTTAKYLIAPRLREFAGSYPKLGLEFILGTDRADFAKSDIDVAILSGRPTELSLVGKPLMVRQWVIAAAPSYLERYGTPVQPEDLLKHQCLNFTIRTNWNTWTFREEDGVSTINLPSYMGANQGELLRTLAIEGLGIVRLAEFNIAADIAAGRLVPLLQAYQEASEDDRFYLLFPKGREAAPRARAVIDFLYACLREQA